MNPRRRKLCCWYCFWFCCLAMVPGCIDRAWGQATSANVFEVVRFEQKMNAQIPLDLAFQDHTGKSVTLRQFFGKRPVILNLVYYECPMLCTMSMNGLVRGLRPLELSIGDDFDVLTISFDPREKPELAAAKRSTYLKQYGRASAAQGWSFLTGRQKEIDELCRAVGFYYVYDSQSQQFAHPGGIVILTPTGRVARYLFDVEFAPRDLRFGLIEASNGRIGRAADQLLLMCYGYDPATGKYALVVMNIVRAAGALTVAAIAGFIGINTYRERRKSRASARHSSTQADVEFPGQEP